LFNISTLQQDRITEIDTDAVVAESVENQHQVEETELAAGEKDSHHILIFGDVDSAIAESPPTPVALGGITIPFWSLQMGCAIINLLNAVYRNS